VPDREAHVGPRQRVAAHRLQAVRQLGGVGLEELAPRRRAEEQLAHLHRGAGGARGRRSSPLRPSSRAGVGGVGGAAGDLQSAIALMAASASPRKPIVPTASRSAGGDLAGGMARSASGSSSRGMPHAVVLDRDQAHAAGQQPHRDLRGAGVQRVVHQLAHHRGRALHHLAGGDLADQLVGQFADGAARRGAGWPIHRGIYGACGAGTRARDNPAPWTPWLPS
jgi:hypothetical protein